VPNVTPCTPAIWGSICKCRQLPDEVCKPARTPSYFATSGQPLQPLPKSGLLASKESLKNVYMSDAVSRFGTSKYLMSCGSPGAQIIVKFGLLVTTHVPLWESNDRKRILLRIYELGLIKVPGLMMSKGNGSIYKLPAII
jgi:hypothetical protein